jgi:hypothetical protein
MYKNDDIVLIIHDEKTPEQIELTQQSNNREPMNNDKNHYKIVKTNMHGMPRPRRKTRSFPIESKMNRRQSTEQNTPNKLTPPTSSEKNQKNENLQTKTKAKKYYPTRETREQTKTREMKEEDHNEFTEEINWDLGCVRVPKDCIVYFSQMIIIGCVISVSLYKLSTENDKLEFWASLLSGSVGYILPQPTLKKRK